LTGLSFKKHSPSQNYNNLFLDLENITPIFQQSAISNQQSAISNQQSAISNQQSAISNQQSAI